MKKKIFIVTSTIVLLCFLIISFYNYKNASSYSDNKNSNNLTLITSFYPVYVSTLNIIKDVENVELINLTNSEIGCLHDYQLSPKDLKTLKTADALIINGANMEEFLDKVIDNQKDLSIIDSSKDIQLLYNETVSSCDHDHEHEHDNSVECSTNSTQNINSHIWLNIQNNISQVKNITDELCDLDPKNKEKYLENSKEYITKLENLESTAKSQLSSISNKNIITFHDSFSYLLKDFGVNILDTVALDLNSTPSPKELENLVNLIDDKNVKTMIVESNLSSDIPSILSKETDISISNLDPVVSGECNSNSINDYIDKMSNNFEILKEALK